ncbi:hypothetical protein NM688_g4454 [Phlebia brevispora]|uniref:Uncharacterized protein n=1 Tax=Phlebia brevispora TaxID=194682 RepID=A0ACC1T2Y3_9APHY|nr:hypothetical protein NM688_g4454 [Phlebia brevispora]
MSLAGAAESTVQSLALPLEQSLQHEDEKQQEHSVSTTIELAYHEDQAVTRPGFARDASDAGSAEKEKVEADNSLSDTVPPLNKGDTILDDLEYSAPPLSHTTAAIERNESKSLRRFRMFSAFCALFLAGWNGGSTGALIPYVESNYRVNYAQVSVLFVSNFAGYIIAAISTGPLSRRVGFGYGICIATFTELLGNVINSSQKQYIGIMCFGFAVVGFSYATQLGLCNAYFATLDRPMLWTCLLHGVYGFGSFASPQVATAMVTRGIPYNLFYTINIGMNLPILLLVFVAFRKLKKLPEHPTDASASLQATLKNIVVWTLAFFLMFYIGAEESLGGWIVSFILKVRKGSPEGASWVASAFYLGIAVGRLVLPMVNIMLGERRIVFAYMLLAITLQCLAWLIPSLASTAVCTAFMGFAISTFYSAAIAQGGKLVPRNMHADAFSIMSAVGQSGQASWPLIVGIISTKKGIWVVEPTVVALLGAQAVCWCMYPASLDVCSSLQTIWYERNMYQNVDQQANRTPCGPVSIKRGVQADDLDSRRTYSPKTLMTHNIFHDYWYKVGFMATSTDAANVVSAATPTVTVDESTYHIAADGLTGHTSTVELGYHADQVVTRPTFARIESTLTTPVSVSGNPSIDNSAIALAGPGPGPAADSAIVSGHAYPPVVSSPALVEIEESKSLRRFRMFTAFCALFLAGWNGGSTGAMIPYIERTYQINYARVSVLFVSTFVGYIVAAATAGPLSRRVGFGHALCISTVIELMGNIINSSQKAHFGAMCFGFFVVGIAFATQLGLCNTYFATLENPLLKTGFLHGIYGLGAFASPQVATAMVSRGIPYNLFYTTNIGMNVPVLVLVWFTFRNLQKLPDHAAEASSSLWDTLQSKAVWTLAMFLMLYVGAEESLGGWIVSYVLVVRKGSPEGASWVASAFYLGIAVGRIVLPALNLLLGERRAVFVYILVAIGLEAVAWFVPDLVSTAVCTALVGLAISTFYSAAIAIGGKLIPRAMHADAFSLMSAVGQSGSALWPLVVGIMSAKKGIWVVEPTVVALLGAQAVCWWFVPKVDRREE